MSRSASDGFADPEACERPQTRILGVTGHQNLGDPEAAAWVATALRQALGGLAIDFGLTSLAAGTDQRFAEQCLAASIAYQAVIPCEDYALSFADADARTRFHALLAKAQQVHRLPFPRPSEEAYFAAGKWIVNHCYKLLAVWNGLPARGLGGTGDVVQYAVATGRPVLHINPIARTTGQLAAELFFG